MIRIISEKYDEFGNLMGYVTDDGQVISKDRAIELARRGEISGVMSGVNENGERVLHLVSDAGSGREERPENPMNNVDEIQWVAYSKKLLF